VHQNFRSPFDPSATLDMADPSLHISARRN
jgi:hypothetical protein